MNTITEEMKEAMQGMIPTAIATCSKDGIPNVAYISQCFYVDPNHVALSYQFFNKSLRNVAENPKACVSIVSPDELKMWKMYLLYSHRETDGPVFEKMRAQLEAIASMTGMENVFNLKGAEIFEILEIERI